MSVHQPKAREKHRTAPASPAPDPARPSAGLVREHRRRSLFAYLTLSPTLAVVGLLMAYPLYVAIDLSLR
ncbi:sugar ABC transporter permease, partial [Streptomyces sp. J15]|nr:sugar ABC transporter permease [Streptomyces pakalii]